jgi:hypothetical protein
LGPGTHSGRPVTNGTQSPGNQIFSKGNKPCKGGYPAKSKAATSESIGGPTESIGGPEEFEFIKEKFVFLDKISVFIKKNKKESIHGAERPLPVAARPSLWGKRMTEKPKLSARDACSSVGRRLTAA